MSELSNKTVLVYDHGQFTDLATRLTRDFGRVLYYKPWKRSAPTRTGLMVGNGIDGVERVRDLWDVVNDVDLFCFPDCYDGDLQIHLESLGKRVWGGRKAERYEFMRELFKKTLKEVGLPVNPYKVVTGVTTLRKYLVDHPDQIVKISLCRGDGETFDVPYYAIRKSRIDALEKQYGPVAEQIRFVVESKIDTQIEVGYDGICIDGQYTDGFVDYETKNEACLIAVKKYDELPESVREVNEAFAPVLKKERCRSTYGTEIRIDKKGTPFYIDATVRTSSPPGEALWELAKNLSEIMWEGSTGEFVQLEPTAQYGCEIMLYMEWQDRDWQEIHIPDEIRQWVKLCTFCKVDDLYYPIPNEGYEPLPWGTEEIGCAIGIGDTIDEAIEAAKEHAAAVEGFKLSYSLAAVAEACENAKAGEKQGVEFAEDTIPEVETIMNGE